MSKSVEKEVKPDCTTAEMVSEKTEWVTKTLDDTLEVWYDTCSHCFPDGKIDVDEVVIKRYRRSTSQHLHRLR